MNSQQRRVALRQEARRLNLYPHQVKVMRSIRRMAKRNPLPVISWPLRFGKTFNRGQVIDNLIVIPKPEVMTGEVTMRQLKARLQRQHGIVLADEAHIVDEPSKSFVDAVKDMPQHFRESLIETPVRPDDLNHGH